MNEVTRIHLGRQAFTISIDAHHELKTYLEDIEKQVDDKDVMNEIELRMAELLSEHGINANKVVLPDDVSFLKAQLGNPKDFKEDEDEVISDTSKQPETKRLFRDADNAMVAGVASGLAQYLGVDVLLVRILFVIAVIVTFGWGILLYIVLWVLVPETKTSSDRLKMAGKPVNVDSLKEIAGRADVKGAARRVNATLSGPVNNLFRFLLKILGIIFILFGLSVVFGLIASETYISANSSNWDKYNIFPIGFREHLLLDIAALVVGLIGLFIVLFGISIFRRKWPIRSWVTGTLVGLVFIGLAVGGALGGSVYPNIHDRYDANTHSSIRSFTPFTAINISGDTNVNFQYSNTYYVELNYYGRPNLKDVKIIERNKTLNIDSSQFNSSRSCQTICIPSTYNLMITVYSPNTVELSNNANFDGSITIAPAKPHSPGM